MLNNKGFAITSILYGILILFVALVGTYLTVLSSKKNKVDRIMDNFEEEMVFNTCIYKNDLECEDANISYDTEYASGTFEGKYFGKYVFTASDGDDNTLCYIYGYYNTNLSFDDMICDKDIEISSINLKQIYVRGGVN